MADVGIITGTGVRGLSEAPQIRSVQTPYGMVETSVFDAGGWSVAGIARHGRDHHHLPHTVPHVAHVTALASLGVRAIVAVTVVGAVDPELPLGRCVLFDDLHFPENRLPGGEPCTVFSEPGTKGRGHLLWNEPFSPRLRERAALAIRSLGLEVSVGGTYGHTNGPRFETAAEIRVLRSAGVAAVSQTCGPEAVLAAELEIPYLLIGFPVNGATGTAEPETKADLDARLLLAAEVLPQVLRRTAESLREEDFTFDHAYVYRFGE
jgi:5'-methylthioadenosine phosphorylase